MKSNNKGFPADVTIHKSLDEIDSSEWNSLVPSDSPALRYEFLSALEKSGCVARETGWDPHHLGIYDNGKLITAAPCYLKYHSYGEYIFDWDWAHAYQRMGIPYYPKVIITIPFTPISGKRILTHPDINCQSVELKLAKATQKLANLKSASSTHFLFTSSEDHLHLNQIGFIKRNANQFHWRNEGYSDFDDFLSVLSSKKRKNILKERSSIKNDGITFRWLTGETATGNDWSLFFSCYQSTIKGYSAISYLNSAFFELLAQTMPKQIRLLIAKKRDQNIAAAFFLSGKHALFGRYWGSTDKIRNLHFETCFYQPIEYCINNKLTRFEAGAQGEHKLNRGLMPIIVSSMHWIKHPEFFNAIKKYSQSETTNVAEYQAILENHSPYKKSI